MEFLSLSRRGSSSQNVPKWQLEILAKALPHVNDFLAYISLCQLTFPEPNLLLKFSVGNQKEYYQWRFTNQPSNLWSLSCGHDVLHASNSSIVGATYEHLKICSLFLTNLWLFSSAWKRKKGIEDWAKLHLNVYDNFRLPRYMHGSYKSFWEKIKDFSRTTIIFSRTSFPKIIIWRKDL